MEATQQQKQGKGVRCPVERSWHEMNRKQRRELTRRIQAEDLSLEVVHSDAAGVDIGNESHYVAVPATRDRRPVQRFGCTTAELKEMAMWLKQCRIRTVALQSTGVYFALSSALIGRVQVPPALR
jgi:ribosomal protein L19E